MTEDEAAKRSTEIANSLLEVNEQMTPFLDSADGLRKNLEGRGWSPTAAETAALTWLCGMINGMFTSNR